MVELAKHHEVSSLHASFCTEEEWKAGGEIGLLQRRGLQYHWENRGYGCYDDFLDDLKARKRKALRKERRRAAECGARVEVRTGDDIRSEHWDAFYDFYLSTIDRKWASAYLTREFFEIIGSSMADRIVLIMAELDGKPVAGAFNLLGRDALYGRYWGATKRLPFLHFEACYHRAIDIAIERGLARVEAGAQGQHKIQRGYMPVYTYSLHWIASPNFRNAIADFLEREKMGLALELEDLTESGPFRIGERTRRKGRA
jgi:predicted N-acyltransferase